MFFGIGIDCSCLRNDRKSSSKFKSLAILFVLAGLLTTAKQEDEQVPILESESITLDYTLYAQLYHELNSADLNPPGDDGRNRELVDYFKLNQESLKKYDKYLYFPESERVRLRDLAKSMFEFGYDSYMTHAFPMDELDPINCRGRGPDHAHPENININDVLGDYMLTLVDTLPTLAVLGNASEFKRASRLIIDQLSFDKDSTVQVFEATIRILGGLLSAHLIIVDKEQPFGDMTLPNYNNELLELAHDLAIRLLQAFENPSNIPHPRVNLKYGVPSGGFNHTCTSGAGTLMLEFGMLSRLLKDPIYERVARKAVNTIFSARNNLTGLVGNELHIHSLEWLGKMSGLGAGLDSFYEYMIKSYILFGDPKDYDMFSEVEKSLKLYLRRGRAECQSGNGHHPIYINVNKDDGKAMNNWIDSLQAFFPGVQILNGDLDEAICFHAIYYAVWKKFGVLPERFNWNMKLPDVNFYPLRPEFAESTYFLYRATKNPFYLHVAKSIIENLYELTKVRCGFATVHDVIDKSLEDRMESFFLSETMKYLYLTFDIDHYLNNMGAMKYVFTTEGHIFPLEARSPEADDDSFRPTRPTLVSPTISIDNYTVSDNSSRTFKMRKKYKLFERGKPASEPVSRRKLPDLVFSSSKCTYSSNNSSASFYRNLLPMKIKYFDQLFDLVGVYDNLESLLERKTS